MMVPEFSPGETNHSVDTCRASALAFLQSRQYGEVEPAYYQVNFGMVTFNFVPVQDGVRLYPDLIKVQVSLETGQVVGVEANNYLRNHVQRDFSAARMEPEAAVAWRPRWRSRPRGWRSSRTTARRSSGYELRGTAEGRSTSSTSTPKPARPRRSCRWSSRRRERPSFSAASGAKRVECAEIVNNAVSDGGIV